MFTKEQIDFMLKHEISIDFSKPLSDDDLDLSDDKVSLLLQTEGFDKDYEPTPIGTMAESIMDALATM